MKKFLCLVAAVAVALALCGCQQKQYEQAQELYALGNYQEASKIFSRLGGYEDSAKMVTACAYGTAQKAYDAGDLDRAESVFTALGDYGDSRNMVLRCRYDRAVGLFDAGEFAGAWEAFAALGEYADSARYAMDARYYAIAEYIRRQAEPTDGGIARITAEAGGVTVYLAVDEEQPERLILGAEQVQDLDFFISTDRCELGVTRGVDTVRYELRTETVTRADGQTGAGLAQAAGTVELQSLTAETRLERTGFSAWAVDTQGNEYTADTPTVTDLVQAVALLPVILEQADGLLERTGTGYSLRELGFAGIE